MSVDAFLIGTWESTEAFGNTALDWSEDVKAGKAVLRLTFGADGRVQFAIAQSARTYAHVLPPDSSFNCHDGRLTMQGDPSGLEWHYQKEDESSLRLRLVGAKRFGRCNGVDNIYLRRVA
ncbi:hypothetical protein ACHHYP_02718 [Achlya hypogyna]|uniref:Lipocalin-like domain-containing protein n=1 Tax=Achlya hypogyna TaxID=1202772 RepID=A0A1V9ZS37_ACHHY|nr:hypothetical protein ACHHYP_02718 [Achlya hypogyna]